MPFLEYQRLVVAYHGCDQAVVDSALRGEKLKSSANNYDWLGTGIYFWEHGPSRAWEWANFMVGRKRIKKPAVVGALIQLGNCFDLLDVKLTNHLRLLFPIFESLMKKSGRTLPLNDPTRKLHRLDCAFLNWAIPIIERDTETRFQTVRGVFIEGDSIYPSAQLFMESHIQVVVRDASAILGYFYPTQIDKG